jgi:membrane protease YdiL (CAAX protease family)
VLSLVLATVLGIVAILVTPLSTVLAGTAGLPGDRLNGSEFFRACASVKLLASAALIEEAGIRGQTQFGLQQHLRPIAAEVVANVVFVPLHVVCLGNPREALFMCLFSIAAGRIAAVTQSIKWPFAVHLGSDLIIAGTVLYNRA